ncbi:MAG: DivIVA domain-containing protein [Micropruina sp.]|nr:DivIVA domain-containing protein [Micropruina sp.]
MSHQPEETGGLDLFDETASAAGSFPHAMLGYERQAVDAYVRDIERQLSSAKRRLRSTQKQLADSRNRTDDTDYSRLGAHTGDLLRVAETQASELIQHAELEAERIRREADTEARQLLSDARLNAEEARSLGIGDLQRLRNDLGEQTGHELSVARDQAAALRAAADQHRDMVVAEAEQTATALVEGARLEADQLRQAAHRAAMEAQASIARDHETALAELKAKHDEVTANLAELVATTRQQSEEFGTQLAADALAMDERRRLALAEVEQVTLGAAEEARALVANAKARAERILIDARAKAAERSDVLRRETVLLTQRKQAIKAQLASLSILANRSFDDFPDAQDADMSSDDIFDGELDSSELDSDATLVDTPAVQPADEGETRVQARVKKS